MQSIDAADAQARFLELLDRLATGESVVITRDGNPLAQLLPVVPTIPAGDRKTRADAIEGMKELAKKYSLGGLDWKALRDEGRK